MTEITGRLSENKRMDEFIGKHIKSLRWSDQATEHEKTLVIGNIFHFANCLSKEIVFLPAKPEVEKEKFCACKEYQYAGNTCMTSTNPTTGKFDSLVCCFEYPAGCCWKCLKPRKEPTPKKNKCSCKQTSNLPRKDVHVSPHFPYTLLCDKCDGIVEEIIKPKDKVELPDYFLPTEFDEIKNLVKMCDTVNQVITYLKSKEA
jgi:hypothetical protein